MHKEYEEKYKPLELHDIKSEDFSNICCPNCETEAQVENLNLDKNLGKCTNCNVIFSFEKDIVDLQSSSTSKSVEIKRPAGIDILHLENELELTLEQPYSIPYLIYVCFGFIPAIGSSIGAAKSGHMGAIMLAAFFIFLYFFTFFKLIFHKRDKVYITIDSDNIHIEYRPKNFIRDRHFSRSDIEQLYVKTAPNGLALYIIVNSTEGQKHEAILGRFTSIGKAKYVEQEIEKYLGISNQKVPGEMG